MLWTREGRYRKAAVIVLILQLVNAVVCVPNSTILLDLVSSILASEYAPFTETPWLKMQNNGCWWPTLHRVHHGVIVSPLERLVLRDHLILAAVPGHVVDARCLNSRDHLLWQNALHLCSVDAGHVALQSLIPCDPALRCVCHSNQALEDLRCAVVDVFGVTGKFKDVFAVGAATLHELCVGAHDGADHTGAQIALLVGWDKCAAGDHVGHLDRGFVNWRV